jgi:ribosomal protein L11 methylase PrmA
MHLHLHARMSTKHAGARTKVGTKKLSARQLSAIAASLKAAVQKLGPKRQRTEWGDYYADTNYSDAASETKRAWVRQVVARMKPASIWDLGGNDGRFSRSICDLAAEVVCLDIDPAAVSINYRACKQDGITNLTPLVFDCCNPSPSIGFANRERPSLLERGRPDLAMALALIHHLAISNNVPLPDIARFLAGLSGHLIIEFVGKNDSQVQRLLANRRDVFDDYSEDGFRSAFGEAFEILERHPIADTQRVLYFMRARTVVD